MHTHIWTVRTRRVWKTDGLITHAADSAAPSSYNLQRVIDPSVQQIERPLMYMYLRNPTLHTSAWQTTTLSKLPFMLLTAGYLSIFWVPPRAEKSGLPGACNWKCQTLLLIKENFGFYYINFYRLYKKPNMLNKLSKISRPTKGQICFLGLVKGQTWQPWERDRWQICWPGTTWPSAQTQLAIPTREWARATPSQSLSQGGCCSCCSVAFWLSARLDVPFRLQTSRGGLLCCHPFPPVGPSDGQDDSAPKASPPSLPLPGRPARRTPSQDRQPEGPGVRGGRRGCCAPVWLRVQHLRGQRAGLEVVL